MSLAASRRSPSQAQESRAIVRLLRVGGYLSGGGFLLADPQRSAWRAVVSAPLGRRGPQELGTLRAVARDDLSPATSPLAEVLNRAYALAETTAEHINATLAWFLEEG